MRFRADRLCRRLALAALPLLAAAPLAAQTPTPTPTPFRTQDELDFGRSSLAIGSGARALGMGGAFLARPDDATAASWNPAGLSYLRLPEVSLVGVLNTQDLKNREGDTLAQVDHTRGTTPDFLSLALPVTLGSVSGAVQLSFQRVIPFSGERTVDLYGDNRVHVQVQAHGGFDVIALGTGLKLTRWMRAGVTVNRWMNGFDQLRERSLQRPSLQQVDFRIAGYNLNAGIIVHPHETLNLGVVVKTRMRSDVTLQRSRTDFAQDPADNTSNSHTSPDVRLDLPGAVGFGASWRPSSPLTLSADYTRTFWSRSRIYNYFTLPRSDSFQPEPEVFASLPFPNVLDDRQGDTDELRLGGEYVFILGRVKLPLRAGYSREKQSKLDHGQAPRYDGVSAGAGLVLGPVLIDAAYVYQWGKYGVPESNNTVRLRRALVSLIYRHGG